MAENKTPDDTRIEALAKEGRLKNVMLPDGTLGTVVLPEKETKESLQARAIDKMEAAIGHEAAAASRKALEQTQKEGYLSGLGAGMKAGLQGGAYELTHPINTLEQGTQIMSAVGDEIKAMATPSAKTQGSQKSR